MPHSKFHQDYWLSRVRQRKFTQKDGANKVVPEWQAYIQHDGRRDWFQLATANKVEAARTAATIYRSLRTRGWDATLAEFKHKALPKSPDPTIGEFFEAIRPISRVNPSTLASYFSKFRKVAADINGLTAPSDRYDYHGTGNIAWRTKVEGIRLSTITPEKVSEWLQRFVAPHEATPNKFRHAKTSANAYIRMGKSLFSEDLRKRLTDFSLPKESPFEGVKPFEQASMRYISQINPASLFETAEAELAKAQPQSFIILTLGLVCGLRRKEIDNLLWSSVDFENGYVHVEATEHFQPKRETSLGRIAVDKKYMDLLAEHRQRVTGAFVIESRNQPRPRAAYAHYRAAREFKKLSVWLKEKGISSRKPIHTLRKEYGRIITEQHGIFQASRLLRHAGIQITAAHYADDQRRLTPNLQRVSGTKPPPTEH